MGRTLIIAALLASSAAHADVAVVYTDQQKNALIQVLGAALMAQPQSSPTITILLDLINTAPTVVRNPPTDPPKDDKP